MVQIIGVDESVFKEATCRNCASRLRYRPTEVRSIHGTDISGGPDGCEYIDCPSCGVRVILRSW